MRRWRGRLTRIVSAVDTARLSPLEPLARAYQRAVPEHPADDGLFGPRSIVWRVNRDRSFPLAGMRSLMIQALHPLAVAGGGPHSHRRPGPVRPRPPPGRLLLATAPRGPAPAPAAGGPGRARGDGRRARPARLGRGDAGPVACPPRGRRGRAAGWGARDVRLRGAARRADGARAGPPAARRARPGVRVPARRA